MGRPSYVYRLGEAAANYFPRHYDELAITVLETIEDLYGRDAIDAVFRMRSEHIFEKYRQQINEKTLDGRLDQLTRLRAADGYMSSWEIGKNGAFILREANCPIFHVAEGCGTACDYDLTLLTNLLDAKVVRKTHLASGDEACSYEIYPKTEVEQ